MNKEIKQILENQKAIMEGILYNKEVDSIRDLIIDEINKTRDLLNPKREPILAEKTHDGLKELNNTEKSLEEENEN